MRFVGSFVTIFLMGFTACNTNQQVVDDQAKYDKMNQYIMTLSAKVDSLEKIIEENQRQSLLLEHDSILFTLQRTPCLGTCPVYKLEVYSDGFVKYKGRNYVDLIGDYTGRLKPEQLASIRQYFKKANFSSFLSEYNDKRLDIPATIIGYYESDGFKTVEARTEIPNAFRVLTSELENLMKEIDWTLED